jgi:hypothetical protein
MCDGVWWSVVEEGHARRHNDMQAEPGQESY